MFGFGHKTGKPLRQQLLEARDNVERQIDILVAGPASKGKGGGFIDNSGLIEELRGTLREINKALNGLGPDDAKRPAN